jgi:hypothetical protein
MIYSVARIHLGMVSLFREPVFRLGVQASDIIETFYKAFQSSQRLNLNDLLTFGGNSYADLHLRINIGGGAGWIDITPSFLQVELRDHPRSANEQFQLCEDTLRKALKDVEISERRMRASLWLVCDGGSEAVEAFLGEKGNAALKLDQGAYAALKKEFSLRFSGLDASKAKKVGLALERSIAEGNLFLQYDHANLGSPGVTQTVNEQFDEAAKELGILMRHIGLEPKGDHAGAL